MFCITRFLYVIHTCCETYKTSSWKFDPWLWAYLTEILCCDQNKLKAVLDTSQTLVNIYWTKISKSFSLILMKYCVYVSAYVAKQQDEVWATAFSGQNWIVWHLMPTTNRCKLNEITAVNIGFNHLVCIFFASKLTWWKPYPGGESKSQICLVEENWPH